MTITLWCLFAVLFMPIVLAGIGGVLRVKQLGSLDNKHPRQQVAQLTGAAARAYAAQENAWEAAILFSAAALTSHVTGVSAEVSAPWALAFVGARLGHAAAYLANQDIIRSLMYLIALVCVVALFVQAV